MDPMARINELRDKKNSRKNKGLSDKEAKELRTLVKENCRLFVIITYEPDECEALNKILDDNDVIYERFIMPESFDLKFF